MILARNSFGDTIALPGKHLRAELLKKLGRKHAEKIYADRKDGDPVHVGYVIASQWWTFYAPIDLEKPAEYW